MLASAATATTTTSGAGTGSCIHVHRLRLSEGEKRFRGRGRERERRGGRGGGGGEVTSRSSRVVLQRGIRREQDIKIANLRTDYCDDFECRSSPAIEIAVRQLAYSISNLKYQNNLFKDRNTNRTDSLSFLREWFNECTVDVVKMEMLELDVARISWTFSGSSNLGDVDLECDTTYEMNPLTGAVEEYKEECKTVSSNFPSLAYSISSFFWTTSKVVSQKVEEVKESVWNEEEGENSQYFVDPTDPKKYIQQQDTTFDDAIQFGMVLALLYACVQVLKTLEGVN